VVSRGGPAYQQLDLQVAAGATLEWLPQETIVFSAAQAELTTSIELEGDARLFYWDVVALGRPASGERFDLGHFQAHLDIRRDGHCSGTSASALWAVTVCSTRPSGWMATGVRHVVGHR
jgi:urease accessory protein UreH